jgi:hypothetical protein
MMNLMAEFVGHFFIDLLGIDSYIVTPIFSILLLPLMPILIPIELLIQAFSG